MYNKLTTAPKVGDVFAFGGMKGFFSHLIRVATWNPVTHVAMVGGYRNGRPFLVESTTLYRDQTGVQINDLMPRLEEYKEQGRVWWLPLSTQARSILNEQAVASFLLSHVGRAYDYRQVVGVALNAVPLFHRLLNQADYNRLFCSELVAGAFKAGGIVPPNWGASHVTPEQVCQYRLYSTAIQCIGSRRDIPGFCSAPVFYPEDPLTQAQTTIWDPGLTL